MAAAAVLQHGAAAALVAALRCTSDVYTREAMVFALCTLARATQATGSMLRSGAAELIASLLSSGIASGEALRPAAWTLSELARGSEVRGLAVAHAGGLRALVRLLRRGGPTAVDAALHALDALDVMLADAPAVQAAELAEGAVPALEAVAQAQPSSPELCRRTQRLLDMLSAAQQAQQAQQQGQNDTAGTAGSSGNNSGGGSQSADTASPSAAAPATPKRASRRTLHVCSWCRVEAPAGLRFKKYAACQQVGGLHSLLVLLIELHGW